MATCALCNGRIIARGDLSVAGSEVFHKTCIRSEGTSRSILNRARAEALAADMDKHRAAVEAQQTLERRDEIIRGLTAENRELRAAALKAERDTATQRVTVLALQSRLAESEADAERLDQLATQAFKQRDEAIAQARARPTPVTRDTVRSSTEVDDRDPTEVRMSLLDLDLDK